MKPLKVVAVTVLAGSISIGAAILGQRWIEQGPLLGGLSDNGTQQLSTLPDFRLTDLGGREVASSAWGGKVVVLNFWATWCPVCVNDMPALIRAQEALRDDGVQVVGIAVDRPEDVKTFVKDHPVNYPLLIATPEVIELAKRLGNRLQALPFTVIFDQRGRRSHSQVGEMSESELDAQLAPLLTHKGTAI